MGLYGCSLAYGMNDEGRCWLCGAPLPARRRRYCSTEHHRLYAANHIWSAAKEEAIRAADGECSSCGASEWEVPLEVHHLDQRVRGRARYALGCHNHQDRLLVLCSAEHLNETRWERSRGRPVQLELPVPNIRAREPSAA